MAQRPVDVHPPIVQPVGIQMVAPQHHHPRQNQPSHIFHHQPDPTHALRQPHTEEKQGKIGESLDGEGERNQEKSVKD